MLCFEPFVDVNDLSKLSAELSGVLDAHTGDTRALVGLAGIAGSGKTHIAKELAKRVNHNKGANVCVVIGMDGYHLSRAQLADLPNPEQALKRRGADFTFDLQGFVYALQAVQSKADEKVNFNTFDHAEKDPVVGGQVILPSHKLVIVEGLYLHMDTEPMNAIKYDARWFIDGQPDVCKARVIKRHVEAGICENESEATEQWEDNDKINGNLIIDKLDESRIDLFLRDSVDQLGLTKEEPAAVADEGKEKKRTRRRGPALPSALVEKTQNILSERNTQLEREVAHQHAVIDELRAENAMLRQALSTIYKLHTNLGDAIPESVSSENIREEAADVAGSWMDGDI